VSLLYEARLSKLDRIYRDAPKLFNDKEDLMHKALGWVLREAGKKDAARLRIFLKRYGKQMPRTALRYAIERFPIGERKMWILSTRS
jgi:3-methyladenine DNA glycosylase AlkD